MEVKVMTATISHDIVDAADTSQTITVFTTKPNIYIMAIFARVKEAFAGVTLPQVSLGRAGHTDIYVPLQRINAVTDLVAGKAIDSPGACAKLLSYQNTPANIPMIATFSSSSGNLSSLTAGEIEFVVVCVE